MRVDDPLGNREPQTHSAPVRTARLPEPIEQVGLFLNGYSGASVSNFEHGIVRFRPRAQRDTSTRGRELAKITKLHRNYCVVSFLRS